MRAVIKFFFLQGKALKKIHTILTETLACFLPGRAKDLSAPLYDIFGKVFNIKYMFLMHHSTAQKIWGRYFNWLLEERNV
jgi:hypothetical protein